MILHPPTLKIVYLMENLFVNVICMVFFLFHGSFVYSNFAYFYPVFLDLNYLSFSVLLFFPNIASEAPSEPEGQLLAGDCTIPECH